MAVVLKTARSGDRPRGFESHALRLMSDPCPIPRRMRTTQRKGDIATTRAIATFTAVGFEVSIPVTESAAYDLVVDDGEALRRVSASKGKA